MLIAGIFLCATNSIHNSEANLVGPQFGPLLAIWAMMLFGAVLAISAVVKIRRKEVFWEIGNSLKLDGVALISALLPIGVGGIFLFLFPRIGYLSSIAVLLAMIFMAVGERRVLRILMFSICGAIVFHILFVGVMGVFMPRGTWFDIATFLGV